MNEELENFIQEQLTNYPKQDVLVYYKFNQIEMTYGFFTWTEGGHVQTFISELIAEGFEKKDIKEFRDGAKKITVTEEINTFKLADGKFPMEEEKNGK